MYKNAFSPTFSSRLLLVFIAFIVAAASYGGFFQKWEFRDGTTYSAPEMFEGTAKRPFVYRQLLPSMANLVEYVTPERINQGFQNWLAADPLKRNMIYRYFPNAKDSIDSEYVLRYYALYGLSFGALFLSLFAIRALCLALYPDAPAATLAAFTFALLLPVMLTEGGYFYDMPELLFMALAMLLAIRGRVWWLAAVVALATFNKESFLFFVIALYPFLRAHFTLKKALMIEAMLVGIAVVINIVVKWHFADNIGEPVESQLVEHVLWLLQPTSYLAFEVNYGVPTPKGFNIIHVLIVAILVRSGWRHVTPAVRQHFWIALAINLPLFLAFCYQGELRNLSMLYMTLIILMAINISQCLQRYRGNANLLEDEPMTRADKAG
jgi:hypothetical protein